MIQFTSMEEVQCLSPKVGCRNYKVCSFTLPHINSPQTTQEEESGFKTVKTYFKIF
jgi:hypothetical protein